MRKQAIVMENKISIEETNGYGQGEDLAPEIQFTFDHDGS